MTIYRVHWDRRIEAKDANEAAGRIFESAEEQKFFTKEEEAMKFFEEIRSSLYTPKKLGYKDYWFEGVSIESAEECGEEETLKESFFNASYYDCIDIFIKEDEDAEQDEEF